MARSLEAARQRSLTRRMQYVSVARSLLEESSGGSFTVQQVVDRSGTSPRRTMATAGAHSSGDG